MSITGWLEETRSVVEAWIEADLPLTDTKSGSVEEAMRYSVLAHGKRLRPQLVLAGGIYVGRRLEEFREPALAVEYLHTYSLIHDDLPAMDNDDWRRGKPTSHRVFGDAMAILAGDALLTEAFTKMADIRLCEQFPAHQVVRAAGVLGQAAGRQGLIEGQVKDLASEGQTLELAALSDLHRKKTGALIVACLRIPAILVGDREAEARLSDFGHHLGLAFQIVDDILNEIGDARKMGKATGTDRLLGKATYPGILGMSQARELALQHRAMAHEALGDGYEASILRELIDFTVDRQW